MYDAPFVDAKVCEELWIAFETGQHLRYIPAHEMAKALRPDNARALPMFHALTGCDTVSAFVGIGKKTCWEVWQKHPKVTQAFVALSIMPDKISDDVLARLERYVILLYDHSSPCYRMNVACKRLFAHKGKQVEKIPPTQDALLLHIKRAVWCIRQAMCGASLWLKNLLCQARVHEDGKRLTKIGSLNG